MNREPTNIEQSDPLSSRLRTEARMWLSLSGFFLTTVIGIATAWVTGGLQTQLSQIAIAIAATALAISGIVGWRFHVRARNSRRSNGHVRVEEPAVPRKFTLEEVAHRKPWPRNRKVVLVTGYFDILHAGHVEFLLACKQSEREVLVVGVHSDELTRRIKGKDRPILSVEDRITAIQGLKVVDYVFEARFFYDDEPYRILRCIDPDIVVFSREAGKYQRKTELVEFVESFARDSGDRPKIRLVPIQRPDIHTGTIVEKIRQQGEITIQQDRVRWLRYIEFTLKGMAASGCEDAPTSAIFAQQGKIVGWGYNTRPTYSAHDKVIHLDTETEECRNGLPRPVHAEINALLDVLKSGEPVDFSQCEVYCLTAPCSACAETLATLRVARVYYFQEFVNNFGILVLKKHGIPCERAHGENAKGQAASAEQGAS